jgi:uncharacterized protein (TIGR03435 family)
MEDIRQRLWVLCWLVAVLGVAAGQDRVSPPLFEVVSIKADKSAEPFSERELSASGRLSLQHYTLRQLIAEAWAIRNDQILAAPRWLDSDQFEIVAKAPAGTDDATLCKMLQNMLAERFGLVVHQEKKALPVFALVAGNGRTELRPTAGGRTFCGPGRGTVGRLHRSCTNMTMAGLAEWLPKMDERLTIDLPVVDLTGMDGAFDFNLDWTPPARGRGATQETSGSTMFEAVAALGLKLQRRQIPVQVLVIDRVERTPSAN